jgi:hypothetical protein
MQETANNQNRQLPAAQEVELEIDKNNCCSIKTTYKLRIT